MSYEHVDLALKCRGLNPLTKLVLLSVCGYANGETNECWPSQTTLVYDTGLCLTTVKKALKELDKLTIVVVVGKRRGGGNVLFVRRQALVDWAARHPRRLTAEALDTPLVGATHLG